jgi:tetratricopeptide (TPR) repeat protein
VIACDCGQKLKTKEEHAGKRVKCPGCGKVLTVPGAAPAVDKAEPSQPRRQPTAADIEEADSLIFSGINSLEANEPDKAIAAFNEAIRRNPYSAAAHSGRGQAHSAKRDCDRAIADWTRAMELDPHDPLPHANRGSAYALRGDYDRAIVDYSAAIKLDSTRVQPLMNRGLAFSAKKDYARAMADYSRILELDPRNAMACHHRALDYYAQNEVEHALSDWGDAVRFNPKLTEAYISRGGAHRDHGDHDLAIADFSEAIGLEPSSDNYFERGRCYYLKDQFREAAADLTECLSRGPKDDEVRSHALFFRGVSHRKVKDYEKAIADLTEVMGLKAQWIDSYRNRAKAYHAIGRYDEALADMQKVRELSQPLQSVAAEELYEKAMARLKKEEYEQAIALFSDGLLQRPAEPAKFYANRGRAYKQTGNYKLAVADLDDALAIAPNDAQLFFTRAQAYGAMGEHERAVADFTRVIQLDPDHAMVYGNRGIAHINLGKHQLALADFTEAIRRDRGDAIAYMNRARLFRITGRHSRAADDERRAEEVVTSGDDTRSIVDRGKAALQNNVYSVAIRAFTEVIRREPDRADAYVNRATALHASGDAGKAIADLTRAQRLQPEDPDVYINRGIVYRSDGDHKRAIADFDEAIRLGPDGAEAHKHRGALHYLTEGFSEAVADYTRAIELDSTDPSSYFHRAAAHKAAGNYLLALADYRVAVQRDPDNAYHAAGLAWLLATCPQAQYRDGKKAVEYATKACHLTNWSDIESVDTLAAAHAEAENFEKAIQLQRKVLKAREDPQEIEASRERIELYQSGTPYHEEFDE